MAELQKVRMLKTQRGVHDGQIHPVTFVEGEEYEVGPGLLASFIDLGVVELADGGQSLGVAPAERMKSAARENGAR